MRTVTFLFILPLSLAAALFLSCCSNPPTEPGAANASDTTTHDWRFELDTLGGMESGAISITAFNKNDAWVAGNFYQYNNPNDPYDGTLYNLAHWDGKKWELRRVNEGNLSDGLVIFGLNPQYIIFFSAGPSLYDGSSWKQIVIPDYSYWRGVRAIWGKYSWKTYLVGYGGSLIRWDGDVLGVRFTNIPTPTSVDLTDIYGNEETIYIVGTSMDEMNSVLMEYRDGKCTVIDSLSPEDNLRLFSVWCAEHSPARAYAGSPRQQVFDGEWKIFDPGHGRRVPRCMSVRGTSRKNVWWAGHFLYLLHYNGNTWREYPNIFPQSGVLCSLSVGEDYLFATGYQDLQNGEARGVVIRGYKK